MGRYRLTTGSYGRREADGRKAVYNRGDVIELTEEDALAMAARIEPVVEMPATGDADETTLSEAEKDAEVHGTDAATAIKHIQDMETVADLKVIEAREHRNPKGPRKTVLTAIASRIAHLKK